MKLGSLTDVHDWWTFASKILYQYCLIYESIHFENEHKLSLFISQKQLWHSEDHNTLLTIFCSRQQKPFHQKKQHVMKGWHKWVIFLDGNGMRAFEFWSYWLGDRNGIQPLVSKGSLSKEVQKVNWGETFQFQFIWKMAMRKGAGDWVLVTRLTHKGRLQRRGGRVESNADKGREDWVYADVHIP